MACDGEVAETELKAMQDMFSYSLYFDGLDHETQLKTALSELQKMGIKLINMFLQELAAADLSERQELQLLEVLLKIIQADGKVEDNELAFINTIKKNLRHLSHEKIMLAFPRHLDLLFNANSTSFGNFQAIDLKAFDKLK